MVVVVVVVVGADAAGSFVVSLLWEDEGAQQQQQQNRVSSSSFESSALNLDGTSCILLELLRHLDSPLTESIDSLSTTWHGGKLLVE